MATTAAGLELGTYAPDFLLPGACGQDWSRDAALGPQGLLVMFICNHCPYVQAVFDRIVRDAVDLQALGVGVVAAVETEVSLARRAIRPMADEAILVDPLQAGRLVRPLGELLVAKPIQRQRRRGQRPSAAPDRDQER